MPIKLENIKIGQVCFSEEILINDGESRAFARTYDPQGIHFDEPDADAGPFGQIVVSGWFTLCLTMKLISKAKPFGDVPVVGVGVDGVKFKKPVFPGDRIAARAEVISKRASSKPGRGYVELKVETRDVETGDIVVSQTWTVMVPA